MRQNIEILESPASMRDIILLIALLAAFVTILKYPFAGVIVWGWMSLMIPQSMVYGFLQSAPINFGIAAATLGMWLVSKERKRLPSDAVPILMCFFVLWMLINSAIAPFPDWSADKFSNTIKTYPLIFLCMIMAQRKARVLALVWVLVISLGFYGAKGGAFTIINGGINRVQGDGGIYIDNNQLALALVMALPLVHYLATHIKVRLLRMGLVTTIILQTIAVLGSYSRGGLLALFSMLGVFWLRSRRKVLYLTASVMLIAAALSIMPPKFFERMNSIGKASQDESFMGRVQAWQVCFFYAVDNFPFGTGFNGNYHPDVYHKYFPDAETHVAHSIYFQVLGDHGFPGLALYVAIAIASLRNARLVVRRCKHRPGFAWAADLAAALEVSQIGFYIGGAALSVPYWDGILMVQALTSVLRSMTDPGELERADGVPTPAKSGQTQVTPGKIYSHGQSQPPPESRRPFS